MAVALAQWVTADLAAPPDHNAFWTALLSFLGQPIALGVTRLTAVLTDPPAAEAAAILVRAERGLQALAVPVTFPFVAQFGADLDVADLPVLPAAVRAALLAGMAGFVTGGLGLEALGPVSVVQDGTLGTLGAAIHGEVRWFRLSLEGLAPEPVVLDCGAGLETLEAAFGPDLVARPVWTGLAARITRDVDFTLGRLVLPLNDLRGLAEGSVVVLRAGGGADSACVRVGVLAFDFRAAETGWTCTAVTDLSSTSDAAHDTLPGADAAPPGSRPTNDLSALEIAVDFDLGRVRVALGEIETWQPGAVVPLPSPASSEGVEVLIRANGRVIGTGDLLRIDDRPAVRITRLAFGV